MSEREGGRERKREREGGGGGLGELNDVEPERDGRNSNKKMTEDED